MSALVPVEDLEWLETDPLDDEFVARAATDAADSQLVEELMGDALEARHLSLLEAKYDDAKHPRWPPHSKDAHGKPRGGQFMKVGQRFKLNGKTYEIGQVANGEVIAHEASGKYHQAETITLKSKPAAAGGVEVAAKVEDAGVTPVTGGKGAGGNVVVVSPYVEPKTHDPSLALPKDSPLNAEDWKTFGREDQLNYLEVQRRFGKWSAGKVKDVHHALYQDYSHTVQKTVQSAYQSQYGSSSGHTFSLDKAFKAGATPDSQKLYEQSRELLRGDLGAALQWDLYNRTRSPDVALFHKGSTSPTQYKATYIAGDTAIMSGYSQSFKFAANDGFGANTLATPTAIRHVIMSSYTVQPVPGESHYANEYEISIAERLKLDDRSVAFQTSTMGTSSANSGNAIRKWLSGITQKPASGSVIGKIKDIWAGKGDIPIPPEPANIVLDSAHGKNYVEPPLSWQQEAGKLAHTLGYANGSKEAATMKATEMNLKAGDFMEGLKGTRYAIIHAPGSSQGFDLKYVKINPDGSFAWSKCYDFDGGGTNDYRKLEGHLDVPKAKAEQGFAPYTPAQYGALSNGPTKPLSSFAPGDLFKVDGEGWKVTSASSSAVQIESLDTGKKGKANPLYKAVQLVPHDKASALGHPEPASAPEPAAASAPDVLAPQAGIVGLPDGTLFTTNNGATWKVEKGGAAVQHAPPGAGVPVGYWMKTSGFDAVPVKPVSAVPAAPALKPATSFRMGDEVTWVVPEDVTSTWAEKGFIAGSHHVAVVTNPSSSDTHVTAKLTGDDGTPYAVNLTKSSLYVPDTGEPAAPTYAPNDLVHITMPGGATSAAVLEPEADQPDGVLKVLLPNGQNVYVAEGSVVEKFDGGLQPPPIGLLQPGDTFAAKGKKYTVTSVLKDGTVRAKPPGGTVEKFPPSTAELDTAFRPGMWTIGPKQKAYSLTPGQMVSYSPNAKRPYLVTGTVGNQTYLKSLDTGEPIIVSKNRSFNTFVHSEAAAPEDKVVPDDQKVHPAADAVAAGPALDLDAYISTGVKPISEIPDGTLIASSKGQIYKVDKHLPSGAVNAINTANGKPYKSIKPDAEFHVLEPKANIDVPYEDLKQGDVTAIGKLDVGDQFTAVGHPNVLLQVVKPADGPESEATVGFVHEDGHVAPVFVHDATWDPGHAKLHAKDTGGLLAALATPSVLGPDSLPPASQAGFAPYASAWGSGGKFPHNKVGELPEDTLFVDKGGKAWKVKQHSSDVTVITDGQANYSVDPNVRVKAGQHVKGGIQDFETPAAPAEPEVPSGKKWTAPVMKAMAAKDPDATYTIVGPNGEKHEGVKIAVAIAPPGGGGWSAVGALAGVKQPAPPGKVWMNQQGKGWKQQPASLIHDVIPEQATTATEQEAVADFTDNAPPVKLAHGIISNPGYNVLGAFENEYTAGVQIGPHVYTLGNQLDSGHIAGTDETGKTVALNGDAIPDGLMPSIDTLAAQQGWDPAKYAVDGKVGWDNVAVGDFFEFKGEAFKKTGPGQALGLGGQFTGKTMMVGMPGKPPPQVGKYTPLKALMVPNVGSVMVGDLKDGDHFTVAEGYKDGGKEYVVVDPAPQFSASGPVVITVAPANGGPSETIAVEHVPGTVGASVEQPAPVAALPEATGFNLPFTTVTLPGGKVVHAEVLKGAGTKGDPLYQGWTKDEVTAIAEGMTESAQAKFAVQYAKGSLKAAIYKQIDALDAAEPSPAAADWAANSAKTGVIDMPMGTVVKAKNGNVYKLHKPTANGKWVVVHKHNDEGDWVHAGTLKAEYAPAYTTGAPPAVERAELDPEPAPEGVFGTTASALKPGDKFTSWPDSDVVWTITGKNPDGTLNVKSGAMTSSVVIDGDQDAYPVAADPTLDVLGVGPIPATPAGGLNVGDKVTVAFGKQQRVTAWKDEGNGTISLVLDNTDHYNLAVDQLVGNGMDNPTTVPKTVPSPESILTKISAVPAGKITPYGSAWGSGGKYKHEEVSGLAVGTVVRDKDGVLLTLQGIHNGIALWKRENGSMFHAPVTYDDPKTGKTKPVRVRVVA